MTATITLEVQLEYETRGAFRVAEPKVLANPKEKSLDTLGVAVGYFYIRKAYLEGLGIRDLKGKHITVRIEVGE